jgi:deazaflavin-dependent oxidoreductase (nitroreductase family)
MNLTIMPIKSSAPDGAHTRRARMNTSDTRTSTTRYIRPGWLDRNLFNRLIAWLTRRGMSVMGTRKLRVVGRASGAVRSTVVNLLEVDGRKYLVSPRGHTQWVRNLRVAGAGDLRVGRHVEPFTAAEVADADKAPVVQAYLERWAWEVGQFFEGLDRHATADEVLAVAPDFPVFALSEPLPSPS